MKTIHNYKITHEGIENQIKAGRYNPSRVIIYKNHSFLIGAGNADDISVFQEGDDLLILSINYRLEYIGLEIFNLKSFAQYGEMFLQSNYEIDEIIGKKAFDLSPMTIAKRMSNYIY